MNVIRNLVYNSNSVFLSIVGIRTVGGMDALQIWDRQKSFQQQAWRFIFDSNVQLGYSTVLFGGVLLTHMQVSLFANKPMERTLVVR